MQTPSEHQFVFVNMENFNLMNVLVTGDAQMILTKVGKVSWISQDS